MCACYPYIACLLSPQVCLIPDSAHGTNAASAHMAGFKPISLKTNHQGGVDMEVWKEKVSTAEVFSDVNRRMTALDGWITTGNF